MSTNKASSGTSNDDPSDTKPTFQTLSNNENSVNQGAETEDHEHGATKTMATDDENASRRMFGTKLDDADGAHESTASYAKKPPSQSSDDAQDEDEEYDEDNVENVDKHRHDSVASGKRASLKVGDEESVTTHPSSTSHTTETEGIVASMAATEEPPLADAEEATVLQYADDVESQVTPESATETTILDAKYSALGASAVVSPVTTTATVTSTSTSTDDVSLLKMQQLDAIEKQNASGGHGGAVASDSVFLPRVVPPVIATPETTLTTDRAESGTVTSTASVPIINSHDGGPVFVDATFVPVTHSSRVVNVDAEAALPVQSVQADDVPTTPATTANTATSADESPLPSSTKASKATVENNSKNHRFMLVGIALGVLVLAAIAIGTTCGIVGCSARTSSSSDTARDGPGNVAVVEPVVYDSVEAYINAISLSNQTVVVQSNATSDVPTPENLALEWLVQFDPLQLKPDTLSHQFRLQQRYAVATLWVLQVESFDNLTAHECEWYGVQCASRDLGMDIGVQNVVTEINLRESTWKGQVTADLGLLSELEIFDLFDNLLTGTLPDSIGRWTNLKHFGIYRNAIYGSLPSSIGQWTDMQHIDVYECLLTGTLPSTIGLWTNVSKAEFAWNYLTGSLPSEIGLWTNVEAFNIAYNNFTDDLPESIGEWSKMDDFNIPHNNLTGTLPESMARWTRLERLDISDNLFTGTVSSFVGAWTNLVQFKLDYCLFSGTIPSEAVANWTHLEQFIIFNNSFVGEVPSVVCNFTNISIIEADCAEIACPCCHQCY